MRRALIGALQLTAIVVVAFVALLVIDAPAEAELGECCEYGNECPGYELCCLHGVLGAAPCSLLQEDYCKDECK
jgi:hypothetical protein